jgi:hypothetical protein
MARAPDLTIGVKLTHDCALPQRELGYDGPHRRWECDLCGAVWTWIKRRENASMPWHGRWELFIPGSVETIVHEGAMISELGARILWRALGEGPNYSPSWDQLLERARILAYTTRHFEEEHECDH